MDGASLPEQLLGAARSNNEGLIEDLLKGKSPTEIASLINTTCDPVGNNVLHMAAQHGSLETLDLLLDQEGVEIDPKNRLHGNTPLHLAVEYAVKVGNAEVGQQVVDLLIECGAQPDPKNNTGKKPIDIAKASNANGIVNSLRGAQYAAEMQRDASAGIGDVEGVDGEVSGDDDGPSDEDEVREGSNEGTAEA